MELYKISTGREIDHFKALLGKVHETIVECQLQAKINGAQLETAEGSRDKELEKFIASQETILKMCADLLSVNSHLVKVS